MFSVELVRMLLESPCGRHPKRQSDVAVWYFLQHDSDAEKLFAVQGPNLNLLGDPNCNSHSVDITSPFERYTLWVATRAGSVKKIHGSSMTKMLWGLP